MGEFPRTLLHSAPTLDRQRDRAGRGWLEAQGWRKAERWANINAPSMSEIGFYHLTLSGPEQALPKLLERTLALNERALVLCTGIERVDALDTALWLCQNPVWLPHATARMGEADLQPIWISTAAEDAAKPPNGARFLFLIDGADLPDLSHFTRVFDLFDGNDEGALGAARTRWAAAKAAGHTLTYWKQGTKGWERGP